MHDDITIANHQNAGTDRPLVLTIRLACNTNDEILAENIRRNSALKHVRWLRFWETSDLPVVIVGGGPSAADHVETIRALADDGLVMGLNGAARWLRGHGIAVDYQMIIDARPENIQFLDHAASFHLLASQVDPSLVEAVDNPILMHLATTTVEDHLPEKRRKRGGYALIGGGYGVGNSAICAAYVMGFRALHCFGFDSSHRDGEGHAYSQPMNDDIPCIDTTWAGKTYTSSMPMKAHAEWFQTLARDLQQMGCAVHVYGDGLLPAMFNTPSKSEGQSA